MMSIFDGSKICSKCGTVMGYYDDDTTAPYYKCANLICEHIELIVHKRID